MKVQVTSHIEIDVRRPTGLVETIVKADMVTISRSDFAKIKEATRKAGRGECIAYRIVTKEIESAFVPTAADIAEAEYIKGRNAITRMMAGGEYHS